MKVLRLLGAAMFLIVAACASRSVSSVGAPGLPTPSVTPVDQVWVAVMEVAQDPGDLSAARSAVLSALGDALEGWVVVSPVGCLEGLPQSMAADGYVLAIQQGSRADARILAALVPEEPRFLGPVQVRCAD